MKPILTPVQQAAIKWWNKLPNGERTRLTTIYGVGVENCAEAYRKEQSAYASELEKLFGGAK